MLYLTHTGELGGAEIALLNLVRALDGNRYCPVVLLFSDGPLGDLLRKSGIETHVLALDEALVKTRKDALGAKSLLRVFSVWKLLRFSLRLATRIRELRVDLVHTNSLKADVIGGVAARLARIPSVWHVRDRIAADYLPMPVVRTFRALARVLPCRIIANSAATGRTLASTVLLPGSLPLPRAPRQVHVVHDGLCPEQFSCEAKEPEQEGPVVGLVGRISPWKGQHVFLNAAARVRRRFPAVRFQLIGAALFSEQSYEAELQELARSLSLDPPVEFLGFRTDVPQLIAQLDILVHASTIGEPFGQVVIEGMASGKPVVATNGGGVPEIVQDGVTGILVPMDDAPSLAEAICRLLSDPGAAVRMGRCGRKRVLEHFTIAQTADRVEAVYDSLLSA